VLASAGYGKTTLLAQWVSADPRPVAWLRLSALHNDATQLSSDLALAIRSAQPKALRRASSSEQLGLRDAVSGVSRPFVLVLDDVHNVVEPRATELLRIVAEQLPPDSQLAVAARREPGLGLARLRANRGLVEVNANDLAMTDAEAAELLHLAGLDIDPRSRDLLVERTEGWPAGLYLAALRLRVEPDPAAAARAFAGDDRTVVEYFRDEVTRALPRKTVSFLVRTSILDKLSGPLCDAVLERDDSGLVIEGIHESNLLLVPLDRSRDWYHCHNLLRDMLQAELRRREPELERALHTRASDWYEANGATELAIAHAQAAGDEERVDRFVWRAAPIVLGSGHVEALASWLEPYTRTEVATRPALTVTAALVAAAAGDWPDFKHWTSVLGECTDDAELPDGTAVRCAAALLTAILAEDGMTRMRDDAADAYRLDHAGSPLRAVACLLEGCALRLLGERSRARERLREGAVIGRMVSPAAEAQCLAQLAVLASEEDQWVEANELVDEAMEIIRSFVLEDWPPMATAFGIAALVHAKAGAMNVAVNDAKHAVYLTSLPAIVSSWLAAESRLLIARTFLSVGDVTMARTLLREAQGFISRVPDTEVLASRIREALERADALHAPLGVIATPLTPAELRVLRFLPTHLTFPAIADDLFISRNTVKTQAISIYRKLGVSSRRPAVEAARKLGFLD
jgi:LuxR family transcriptional regulator, maltose regulon positive regulatory protein